MQHHAVALPMIALGVATIVVAIVFTLFGWKRATTRVQYRVWAAFGGSAIALGLWEVANGISVGVAEGTMLDGILTVVMVLAACAMFAALVMGLRYTGHLRNENGQSAD